MIDFSISLAEAMADVVQRVQRSLVVLHNGQQGVGGGIIWSRDGLVMTNHHVVAQGHIRVALTDGTELPTQILARDPELDLALLRIEAHDLQAASIADSRTLRVGQFVLAVGHPWGQRGAVTVGLISGFGKVRTRGPHGSVEIIRSDVALAPGNSGGPLVDAEGAVVGINTMIVGGDQGIVIPSHVASVFADQVLDRQASTTDHPRKKPPQAYPGASSEWLA